MIKILTELRSNCTIISKKIQKTPTPSIILLYKASHITTKQIWHDFLIVLVLRKICFLMLSYWSQYLSHSPSLSFPPQWSVNQLKGLSVNQEWWFSLVVESFPFQPCDRIWLSQHTKMINSLFLPCLWAFSSLPTPKSEEVF